MPTLTRWFIKTSLIQFVLALVLGVWLALGPSVSGPAYAWLFPIYVHILVLGWLTQLIFGVGFWMFPKFSMERPHASPSLGWATYVLLNAGLLLRAVGEPMNALQPNSTWGWLLVLSAVLQWCAGMAFVLNSWGRIKVK